MSSTGEISGPGCKVRGIYGIMAGTGVMVVSFRQFCMSSMRLAEADQSEQLIIAMSQRESRYSISDTIGTGVYIRVD